MYVSPPRSLRLLVLGALASFATLGLPAAHAAVVFEGGVAALGAVQGPVPMMHLPRWVQVANTSAPLYASDQSDTQVARSSKYTFMRVLGAGHSRLQVQSYDEAGMPGPDGWVDADDVLPSAPGTDWLVIARATTLSQSPNAGSDGGAREVAAFQPAQLLDGPVLGRAQVRVFSPDLSTVIEHGWVDVADTGPALAPRALVADPDPQAGLGQRVAGAALARGEFLDATAQAARAAWQQTGVPVSVTVAQAILESDWGRSELTTSANNYFGIKAFGALGSDGVVWMPTAEFDEQGELYQTVSPFRAYRSLSDSVLDHDLLLRRSGRYAEAMQVAKDPREFATRLAQAGYSTDPEYAQKLIALMDRYDLYRLDG